MKERLRISTCFKWLLMKIIGRCRFFIQFGIAVLGLFMVANSYADLEIPPITEGLESAHPIAIVPFGRGDQMTSSPVPIADIISRDLERSGFFAPIPERELPGLPTTKEHVRFSDWRLLGANLVIGNLSFLPDGRYSIHFRLFDVFQEKQLAGFRFLAPAKELRKIAHKISDIIYEKLTGEPGAFSARIAYITETGISKKKRYTLYVADSDGEDAIDIRSSTRPLLSPAWSPDGRKLAYVSFEGGESHVYVQEIATKNRYRIAAFPGINGAPAWSPDGSRLALTLSKDGNAEIYIMGMRTRHLSRITRNEAIDTEASWAPDGQSLVFTSDRSGTPQIYRVPIRGGSPERITFDGRYNARAVFSPDGARLALVHGVQGVYRIALQELDTGSLRVLTETNLDESPSFSPNGSTILYSTTGKRGSALAAVSIDRGTRYQLTVRGGKVREPAWSPVGWSPAVTP
uniref:Tol-Pal system protein TolB n=1 Tax=Candidatus Kentrum sp. TC TaxID=2126339 RepID=A0A450ZJ06_9GAMM|nr:MAG: TolB protein [Candidatus Kentron sp. TC]VFK41692.1 MAG: TolB protein [Candidatus Kentron sp. TC]VFK53793.1 MAG: TolB protein [Candidatus Kentron sp. TC]